MKMHHGLLDRRDGRRRSQGIVGFGNLWAGPAESAQDAGSEGERDGHKVVDTGDLHHGLPSPGVRPVVFSHLSLLDRDITRF